MFSYHSSQAFLVAQMVKNRPAMQEVQVQSLGQEDPLEKGMVPHSSILAWRILWPEEPGRSVGSQRIRHYWETNTHTHTHTPFLFLLSIQTLMFPLGERVVPDCQQQYKSRLAPTLPKATLIPVGRVERAQNWWAIPTTKQYSGIHPQPQFCQVGWRHNPPHQTLKNLT